MIRSAALALAALIPACQGDETVAGYGAAGKTWQLTELHGATFSVRATLQFPETGRIEGGGPCNQFTASMTVPYPWFEVRSLQSTDNACPDLSAETAFLEALATMSQSEVLGNVMVLRSEDAREMVFKAAD